MLKKIECKRIYLGLGSNSGNRKINILKAVYLLNKKKKIRTLKVSSIYESLPWGYVDQRKFYNAVMEIRTKLKPEQLLAVCQSIEKKIGRGKHFKWAPRVIDIDILIYKNIKKNTKRLTIPHKYITQRIFTLVPLSEIDRSIRLDGRKLDYFIDRMDEYLNPVDS